MRNPVREGEGGVRMSVEVMERFHDGLSQAIHRTEEVVVERASFQIAPQPFNGVEFRTVLGQPDDADVMFVFRQEVQGGGGGVVGGVVEGQDDQPVLLGLQKLPQELVELGGVFLGMDQVVRLTRPVVERPVDAELLVRSGGGHLGPDPFEGPDFGQGRVEMNLTLVEEEEVEENLGFKRAFFKKSKRTFFSLTS